MRGKWWVVLLLVGFLAGSWAGEDPWTGKSRADVVTLLGEPKKAKTSKDGGELLVYKLVRLREGTVPEPGMSVLNVPGVGVVGLWAAPQSMSDVEAGIAPTTVDRHGRSAEGGAGAPAPEEASISWDLDKKEVTRSWEERPAIKGKVTLKFQVNAAGEIESWSVSPKRAAK
jgi:hypothetical protein